MRHFLILAFCLVLAACGSSQKARRHVSAFDLPDAQCRAALQRFSAALEPAAPTGRGACAVPAPVVLARTSVASFEPPVRTACGMALAWLSFEAEADRLAWAHLGTGIATVRNFGSHACRKMTGNGARMSLHSQGKALDIAGFRLEDGRVVDVKKDWGDHNDKGAFLEDLADAACTHFSVVLTPAHDRDHRDHIHVDIGPWQLCGT